jgi:hypothetical protein
MEVPLIYHGPLPSGATKSRKARKDVKRIEFDMRREFHHQLISHWRSHLNLERFAMQRTDRSFDVHDWNKDSPAWSAFTRGKFRFLPLVISANNLKLVCQLDVELHSRDELGAILHNSGDLDNRIEILFDALTMPQDNQIPKSETPQEGENPFLCLLQDDKLITELSVKTLPLRTRRTPNEKENYTELRVLAKVETGPRSVWQLPPN